MRWAPSTRLRDRFAIASSLALHACAIALAVLIVVPSLPIVEQPESPPQLAIMRLERRLPTPKPLLREGRQPAAPAHDQRIIRTYVHAAPPRSAVLATHPAEKHADPDRIPRQIGQTSPNARIAVAEASIVTPDAPAPAASAEPTATPAPPAPRPAAADGDGGLFGQNYHATPNPPQALQAILASMAVHGRMRVHIDEHGKATGVQFLTPIADAALADTLREKILALNYVPADCNGLRCDDELEIHY